MALQGRAAAALSEWFSDAMRNYLFGDVLYQTGRSPADRVATSRRSPQGQNAIGQANSKALQNFVALSGVTVGTSIALGMGVVALHAAEALPVAVAAAMEAGGITALLGTAGALSDLAAMTLFVGAPLGAAAGVALLLPLGAGYLIGTIAYPRLDGYVFHPLYDRANPIP
jgi:hypothetical protein